MFVYRNASQKRTVQREITLVDVHAMQEPQLCMFYLYSFQCKHCGKAFASHAAHDSHVRRTHVRGDKGIPCSVCGKNVSSPFELKCHMSVHINK